MKKTIFAFGMMLAATLSLTNCTKELEKIDEDQPQIEKKEGSFELFAKPVLTKTEMDGFNVNWVGGSDNVNVYHAVAESSDYVSDGKFSISADDAAAGKFKGDLGEELVENAKYDWYVFYPYISSKESPASTSKGWTPIGCQVSSGIETQNGNNSTAHLAGSNFPLYGKVANVASNAAPTVTMEHLAAFVEFNITNNSTSGLTVTSIEFDAPQNIIGTYYISFADPSNIKYTSSRNSYVANSVTLNVENGSEIAVGESAKFYIGIKPMAIEATAESTKTIRITINDDFTKEITLKNNTSFLAGKVKKINVNYDYDPSAHANATYIFNTTAGLNSLGISAPSSGQGTNLSGNNYVVNGINAAFEKGTGTTDIRVWNASGSYELRTYKGNTITFTPPTGFNITKITTEGSSANLWTSTPSGFASGTWTGESSSVVFTSSGSGKVNTITVECTKAPVVPTIVDKTVNDLAARGASGLEAAVTLSNYDSAPTISTVTPDGTIITSASVKDITASGLTVEYTISNNLTGSAREGTITLTDGDGHSGTVTINQVADEFRVTRTELSLGAASGSSTTFTIYSDYDWTIVDDLLAGCTVSPTSFIYIDNKVQTVTVQATGNGGASSAIVGIFQFKRTIDYKLSDEITVTQASSKLTAPQDLKLVGDKDTKKMTVSWTKNDNASKYSYYVLDDDANIVVNETETADNTTVSFVFDFDFGTTYYAYVKSIGDNNPWTDSDYAEANETVNQGTLHELIDLTAQSYSNGAVVTSVAGSVATLTFAKNGGSNDPKYYTSGTSVRTYAKNKLTVSVSSGKKITKIEFTLGGTKSATVTASTGTLGTISGSSRTWTAAENSTTTSVDFTNGNSDQMHYQKVDVYYE